MSQAPNFASIQRWFKENRPDVSQHQLATIMEQPAYVLLMAGAFEAGREFQQRNPSAEKFLDPYKTYK